MDAFIDLFDPLPIAVLFAIFITAGLIFIFGLERWCTGGCGRRHGSV